MTAPLSEVQARLAEAVRRSAPLADDPDWRGPCSEIASGNDRLSGAEQVDIYRRQFWLRHRDCLQEDFPATAHLLGADAFDTLARAYLDAHPPGSYTLRDLGHAMVSFTARYEGFAPELAGYARDLVRFEHAFVDAFDCRDVPAMAPERIAALSPEAWTTARLVLHPSLTLLRLDHPVHRLRQAVREGEPPPPELTPAATNVALYRAQDDLRIHYLAMEARPFELLWRLQAGAPLADACGELARRVPAEEEATLAADLRRWFEAWATRGWVVDVLTD